MITSAQNPKIQKIRALQHQPKERKISGLFVVEGVRLLEEAIQAKWDIEFVLFSNNLTDRGKDLLHQAADRMIDVEEIPFSLMKKVADTTHPQGILAVIHQTHLPIPDHLDFILVCDAISDPGNLGTILRSADAAQVQAVIVSPSNTDPFSPKVVRAGMGAHFHIPIIRLDWSAIQGICKNMDNPLRTYIASANASVNCWDANLKEPCAFIVGSEAQGPGDDAYELADVQLKIPMPGPSESLNVAVATSILLFETVRQRWQ